MTQRYWIGAAFRDYVQKGVKEAFVSFVMEKVIQLSVMLIHSILVPSC